MSKTVLTEKTVFPEGVASDISYPNRQDPGHACPIIVARLSADKPQETLFAILLNTRRTQACKAMFVD